VCKALIRTTAFIYGVAGPAGAFNDVTAGSNTGFLGDSPDQDCNPLNTTAFSAVTGWDATTGENTYYAVRARLMWPSQGGVLQTFCGS
jgi:hypothetical protein